MYMYVNLIIIFKEQLDAQIELRQLKIFTNDLIGLKNSITYIISIFSFVFYTICFETKENKKRKG